MLYRFIPLLILNLSLFWNMPGFSNEEVSTFTISEVQVQNAQWYTPSNGEMPRLLGYDIDFNINQSHRLHASVDASTFGGHILSPQEFIQEGNEIQIFNEGFILGQTGSSWFSMRHLPTSIAFEASGNSIKSPMTPPPGSSPISEVSYSNGKVYFNFQSFYLNLEVASDKYHGFYEGKPLIERGMSFTAQDELGNDKYLFVLEDPENHQEFEARSAPLNDVNVVIQDIRPVNLQYHWAGWGHALYEFNVELTFIDSPESKYTSAVTYDSGRVYKGPYDTETETRGRILQKFMDIMGTKFTILSETKDTEHPRHANLSVQSVKSGHIMHLYGPSRKGL